MKEIAFTGTRRRFCAASRCGGLGEGTRDGSFIESGTPEGLEDFERWRCTSCGHEWQIPWEG
jgi:hypothetical protein